MGRVDDSGETVRQLARSALVAVIAIVASAHIGSPNVIFEGKAGAYDVRVIVRPPAVVPGLAEVTVRLLDGSATRVAVRPVFWRAGLAGSPSPDEAQLVPGQRDTYTAQLWLMARGAYSVYVMIDGERGSGSASVPVMSVATGRLGMSLGLGALLAMLGALLVAALVTIVHRAAGESVAPAGQPMDAARLRRARIVAGVAFPLICIVLLGGAKWWAVVDADYATRMYRPPPTRTSIISSSEQSALRFTVTDSAGTPARLEPLMPDHGRMMHLFLIDTSTRSFAHLHPTFDDTATFTTAIPPLPPGHYRLIGEVVTELGQTRTLTGAVDLTSADSVAASRRRERDADDGWTVRPGRALAPGVRDTLADGSTIEWTGNDPATLTAGEPTHLRFRVRDPGGASAVLEPYLGMPAHAVIARSDGSVFIHLHSMGTVSPAAQQVFALRDRGDTTPKGRLLLATTDSMSAAVAHDAHASPEISIPYEFPRGGDYRIWIQVRRAGRVLTGTFNVHVAGSDDR